MLSTPPLSFCEEETVSNIYEKLRELFELLEYEYSFQELFFFLLGEYPVYKSVEEREEQLKNLHM